MPNLEKIKEMIFETDNAACFIERERILQRLECEFKNYDKTDKYALTNKGIDEPTVRLYGFSENFISLPKWQQIAVINRTRYEC